MPVSDALQNAFLGRPGKKKTSDAGRRANDVSKVAGELGTSTLRTIQASSGIPQGFSTAEEVLASKGQLAPGVADELRLGVAQRGQTSQLDHDQQTARRGLGGSSGSSAISAALTNATAAQRGSLDLDLANQAEARKRDDLGNIFGNLFLNPALGAAGQEQSRQSALEQIKKQKGSTGMQIAGLAAAGAGAFFGAKG